MKKLLTWIMFFLYRKEYYRPLSEIEVDVLLTKLANNNGLENLPRYLGQCADSARNQYLYSNDPMFKGMILGYTMLREQIIKKKAPKEKKKLTPEEEVGIMKGRGY